MSENLSPEDIFKDQKLVDGIPVSLLQKSLLFLTDASPK
jgi:hypothetical protein